jgi:hypothetical protein
MTFPFPTFVPAGSAAPTLTFLNTATNTADQTSYSFTVDLGTAGATRRIFVAVHAGATSAVAPASVTINGVSATSHLSVTNGQRSLSIWSAAVPTGGAGVSIVVTWTSQTQLRCAIGFWAAFNLRDSSPLDTDQLAGTTGANNLSLATEANCILIAAGSIGDSAPGSITFTGVTSRYNAALETTLQYGGGDASSFSGSNPTTVTVTLGTSTDEVTGALSWR